MKLTDIKIENFRGVRSLHLPLDVLTVLIGENNTGKSTVLEAIRLVLTRGFGVRRSGQFTYPWTWPLAWRLPRGPR